MALRKIHPIMKIMNMSLIDMPIPINISMMWNYGSLLGLCLFLQIITGVLLAMHYSADIATAFMSISHISRDMNMGFIFRAIHANIASFFFIFLYLHLGRGLYYGSYFLKEVWLIGVMMIFITMMIAFLGYVLPWGQMSFWGATVITNLVSAIPYMGVDLVQWLWGGFSVSSPTLGRFFVFHFLFPFILFILVILHILFLHMTGSLNSLGNLSNSEKIWFHPYFSYKDLYGFMIFMILLSLVVMFTPNMLMDPENYMEANPMSTPPHIQPEWYFLFAYAILRAIPNKLGGVLALISSISILIILPYMLNSMTSSNYYNIFYRSLFWMLVASFLILTWIGARPVEMPYVYLSQMMTIFYFMLFMGFKWSVVIHNKLLT
uniref:Cytochrome b n=1 Tax=Allobathynella sp. JHS-2017 TaxID=2025385 RepID=A0A7R6D7G1_9CRUS|nr:cytochrome b [Allobathynella sp. JHS-2017]